jgi:acyl dehydratase
MAGRAWSSAAPMWVDFAERIRRTSMNDIIGSAEMTGDRNPLHYNQQLAGESAFGKLIVQGGVTSGILNALVAEDLPGPETVFLICPIENRQGGWR